MGAIRYPRDLSRCQAARTYRCWSPPTRGKPTTCWRSARLSSTSDDLLPSKAYSTTTAVLNTAIGVPPPHVKVPILRIDPKIGQRS